MATPAPTAPPDRSGRAASTAELVERREILPGRWRQRYRAPDLAVGVRAGQYVHVLDDDGIGPPRRRPFAVEATDRA